MDVTADTATPTRQAGEGSEIKSISVERGLHGYRHTVRSQRTFWHYASNNMLHSQGATSTVLDVTDMTQLQTNAEFVCLEWGFQCIPYNNLYSGWNCSVMLPALMNANRARILGCGYKVHTFNTLYERVDRTSVGTTIENVFCSKPLLMRWRTKPSQTFGITNANAGATKLTEIVEYNFTEVNGSMTMVEPYSQDTGSLDTMFLFHYLKYSDETNNFRDSWRYCDYFQSENIDFFPDGSSFDHEWKAKKPYWLAVRKHMNVPHGGRYARKGIDGDNKLYPWSTLGDFPDSRQEAFNFDLAKREHVYRGGGTESGYLSMFIDVLTGTLDVEQMDDHPTFHGIKLMPLHAPTSPMTLRCMLLVTYHFDVEIETVEHQMTYLPLVADITKDTSKNIWDHQRISTKAANFPTFTTFGLPKMGTDPIIPTEKDGPTDAKKTKTINKVADDVNLPRTFDTLEQLEFV